VDSSSIELPGSEVDTVVVDGPTVRIRFSRARIVKTMTGSVELTRWWQQGEMVFESATVDGSVPATPAVCAGGDVYDNVYTYRDMVPLPLETRGRAGCRLHFQGDERPLVVDAEVLRLEMEDVPKYIEHIRPD
jgi:hypothetical protein